MVGETYQQCGVEVLPGHVEDGEHMCEQEEIAGTEAQLTRPHLLFSHGLGNVGEIKHD